MILYGANSVNGGGVPLDTYSPATVPVPANYEIPGISIVYNSTGTSATITVVSPLTTPGSYGGSVAGTGSFNDPDFVINDADGIFTLSPLTPGSTYTLRIRAYSGANSTGTYGNYYYDKIVPPKPASNTSGTATVSGTQVPPASANDVGTAYAVSNNKEVQTSLFKITNNNPDPTKYSIAVRSTGIPTNYKYYSFGTSLFFPSSFNDLTGSGGMAFFVDNLGLNGYYVEVQTATNLSDTADKEIKIYKIVNGKKLVLNDSQSSASKTLTGILGGMSYKLDINVTTTSTSRVIEVYVNSFKITAIDLAVSGSTKPIDQVLPITDKIAMFSSVGKTNFDYVYATPITESQYSNGIVPNIYEGKYGINTLSFLYGDKVLSNKFISNSQVAFLDEFGTVARELRKIKVKYEARPADPIYTSVGINKFVSVLGERLTSFGAEVYIINNAGTFVPLDDSNLYSFSIVGNYVVVSGQHEYTSDPVNKTIVSEPIVFQSSWIQSESDAKSLTSWIQNQWSNQQRIVDMEIFGNPLISVGDVVSINYPDNGLNGTEKFVVTKVNNSFGEGLQTTITARSIFS